MYLIGNPKNEANNALFIAYKALRSPESVILLLKTPKIGSARSGVKVKKQ